MREESRALETAQNHGGVGGRYAQQSRRFAGAADVAEISPAEFMARGRSYLEQKRYYEAVTQFNRALEVDPGNRAALDLMREALGAMEKPAEKEKTDAPR